MQINFVEMKRCPSCLASGHYRLLYRLEKFNVFQCPCGVKFIDPSLDTESQMAIYQSSEILKEINPALENYYEYQTLDPQSKTYRDYQRALQELEKYTLGRKLLEVGCGTGSFLQVAAKQGWQAYGVDSGSENIEKLKEKGIEGKACGFMDFQPAEKFDVIVLWDLIEHPQDPGSFLDKAALLLKDKGLILLATPQDPNLLSVLADGFYRISGARMAGPLKQLYIMEHTSYFSEKSLEQLLGAHGFQTAHWWKTETDLARYRFSSLLRMALTAAFFVARLFSLQNRLMMIGRKK